MAESNLRMPPWLVRLAVGLTFFNSFVLFEELVVDRQGLGRYLPFYRVGNLCVYDAAAVAAIVLWLWWIGRRTEQ